MTNQITQLPVLSKILRADDRIEVSHGGTVYQTTIGSLFSHVELHAPLLPLSGGEIVALSQGGVAVDVALNDVFASTNNSLTAIQNNVSALSGQLNNDIQIVGSLASSVTALTNKIGQVGLPVAAPLTGAESFSVVQGGSLATTSLGALQEFIDAPSTQDPVLLQASIAGSTVSELIYDLFGTGIAFFTGTKLHTSDTETNNWPNMPDNSLDLFEAQLMAVSDDRTMFAIYNVSPGVMYRGVGAASTVLVGGGVLTSVAASQNVPNGGLSANLPNPFTGPGDYGFTMTFGADTNYGGYGFEFQNASTPAISVFGRLRITRISPFPVPAPQPPVTTP